MTKPMTRPRTIFIAAAATIAAMAVLAANAEPQSAAEVSPLATQAPEQLSATRDRPLFSPTRRPPAPPPIVSAVPPPPPPPPDVALLGVVMDGDEARAVVRTGAAAKIVRVRIGDDIDGWKVGQIEAQRLVLLLDDRTATFTLFSSINTRRGTNVGTVAQSPVEQSAHSTAQPSPSPGSSTMSNPETAHVRRPHAPQQ